jgi:hypothetical protein
MDTGYRHTQARPNVAAIPTSCDSREGRHAESTGSFVGGRRGAGLRLAVRPLRDAGQQLCGSLGRPRRDPGNPHRTRTAARCPPPGSYRPGRLHRRYAAGRSGDTPGRDRASRARPRADSADRVHGVGRWLAGTGPGAAARAHAGRVRGVGDHPAPGPDQQVPMERRAARPVPAAPKVRVSRPGRHAGPADTPLAWRRRTEEPVPVHRQQRSPGSAALRAAGQRCSESGLE